MLLYLKHYWYQFFVKNKTMTITTEQKVNALLLIVAAVGLYIILKPLKQDSLVYMKKGIDDEPKKAIFG